MTEPKHTPGTPAEIALILQGMIDEGCSYSVRSLYELCRDPDHKLFDSAAMRLQREGLLCIEGPHNERYMVPCSVDESIRQIVLDCISISPGGPRYGVRLNDRVAKAEGVAPRREGGP